MTGGHNGSDRAGPGDWSAAADAGSGSGPGEFSLADIRFGTFSGRDGLRPVGPPGLVGTERIGFDLSPLTAGSRAADPDVLPDPGPPSRPGMPAVSVPPTPPAAPGRSAAPVNDVPGNGSHPRAAHQAPALPVVPGAAAPAPGPRPHFGTVDGHPAGQGKWTAGPYSAAHSADPTTTALPPPTAPRSLSEPRSFASTPRGVGGTEPRNLAVQAPWDDTVRGNLADPGTPETSEPLGTEGIPGTPGAPTDHTLLPVPEARTPDQPEDPGDPAPDTDGAAAPTAATGIRTGRRYTTDEPSAAELVRPYFRTKGRTKPRLELSLEALVSTSDRGMNVAELYIPEHRNICDLCQDTRSVAEVAAYLRLPLGVARVLIGDVAGLGLVMIHTTSSHMTGDRPSIDFMERVLSGLRTV